MKEAASILEYLRADANEMQAFLKELVSIETPSGDAAAQLNILRRLETEFH
ncbi:MAG: hypothetical protein HKO11_06775, partial [Eudoraea sp.]|nr:hypothetical protein [Eudoraea sp.]